MWRAGTTSGAPLFCTRSRDVERPCAWRSIFYSSHCAMILLEIDHIILRLMGADALQLLSIESPSLGHTPHALRNRMTRESGPASTMKPNETAALQLRLIRMLVRVRLRMQHMHMHTVHHACARAYICIYVYATESKKK